MTFEEKLRRNAPEDQIEIGQIIDDVLKGSFGYLLKAIIEGICKRRIEEGKRNPTISADRILGWIEALDELTENLDTVVDIKNQLLTEKKTEEEITDEK